MALTAKQNRFVQEYLIDLNATQAAIRAGYSAKTADRIGPELLGKTCVSQAIEAAQADRAARTGITQNRVLRELALLGFANMRDYMTVQADGTAYVDLSALTRDQAAAIQEITVDEYTDGRGQDARLVKKVKVKLADKRASLVDIGRHLGMFTERHELDLSDSIKQAIGARGRLMDGLAKLADRKGESEVS